MLRLTTKVAVSPASSCRSSSAATRISSIASGRVSANSAVSSSSLSSTPSRPFAIARGASFAVDRLLAAPPRPPARNEAPVLQLDHVEDPLLHPLRVHVLRIDAEPLGQRVALGRKLLTHLVRARERVLRRDVIPVRREPAQIGRPGLDELGPELGQVGRHLHPYIRHQPLALADQALDVVDGDLAGPGGGSRRGTPSGATDGEAPEGVPRRLSVPRKEMTAPPAEPPRLLLRRRGCHLPNACVPRDPRCRRPPGRSSAGAGRSSAG